MFIRSKRMCVNADSIEAIGVYKCTREGVETIEIIATTGRNDKYCMGKYETAEEAEEALAEMMLGPTKDLIEKLVAEYEDNGK